MRLINADRLLEGREDHTYISTHEIWNAPTVDAEPIKHGTWTRPSRPKTYERFCSCCGGKSWYCGTGDYAYCPNCGAKMDKKE